MPKRLHRCVAFAVNARLESTTMAQLQSDMQKEIDKQVYLRDEARSEANESQQSARNLFNEQKRLES